MTTTHENVCQHCGRAVRWSRTERGFAGFVHEDTDLAECEVETHIVTEPLFEHSTKAELDEFVRRYAIDPRFRERYVAWKAAVKDTAEG